MLSLAIKRRALSRLPPLTATPILEGVFDGLGLWEESSAATPTVRRVDPPRPITVDVDRALPLGRNTQPANRLPLRVRSMGLRLAGAMAADLHAWLQLVDGQWLAAITLTVPSGRGREHVSLELIVPADSVAPRPTLAGGRAAPHPVDPGH